MKSVFWGIFVCGITFCGLAFALVQSTDFVFFHQGVRFKSMHGALVAEDLGQLPQFKIAEKQIDSETIEDTKDSSLGKAEGQFPVAVTPETEFDFGSLNPLTSSFHRFVVTNEGDAPLSIRVGQTTCKCTIGRVAKKNLAPGESTEVELRWNTGRDSEHYSHSALVHTNDPKRSLIQFRIRGRVLQRLIATPRSFAFPSVRPNRNYEQQLIVRSQEFEAFEIGAISSTLTGLKIQAEELLSSELLKHDAKSGYRVKIALPNDMVSGPFNHMIHISVHLPGLDQEEIIEVPLAGRVTKRISAYGANLDGAGIVDMGKVSLGDEKSSRVIVRVYDDQLDLGDVQIQIEPEFVQAEFEPRNLGQGLYQLQLKIPRDSPKCAYLGRPFGNIRLEFDHPRVDSLQLKLQFAVVE